jgi:hypothetical protein
MEPERPSVFTHPSLQKFIKQNKGASVVVRDPNATSGGVSAAGKTSELCGMIEKALMERGYNPRDRRLFESVAAKMKDVDYVALGEKTRTDLVFEVTDFSKKEYVVRNYQEYKDLFLPILIPIYLKRDVITEKPFKKPRTLYGYNIEIKVILLQDNLIGGTYKYFWTPCALSNCDFSNEIWMDNLAHDREYFKIYSNTYINSLTAKSKYAPTQKEAEEFLAKRTMLKNMKKAERRTYFIEELDKELEERLKPVDINEFVSDVVIPSLFKNMGEESEE